MNIILASTSTPFGGKYLEYLKDEIINEMVKTVEGFVKRTIEEITFDEYLKKWDKKQQLSEEIANKFYQGQYKAVNDEFATKILGEIKDPQTGVMTEKADASLTEFAMMFQFEGDKNKTRYVMYYCFASRPSLGSKTKNGTSTNERELSFKASPRPLDTVVKRSITSADSKDAYDNWFKKVYEPTAVVA